LAPGIVAAIGALARGRVIGTMIDRGELVAAAAEFAAHPVHQRGEVGFAEIAPADAGLVGGDDDGEAARGEPRGERKDAVDEAALVDAVKITRVLVDDAVAIEEKSAPAAAMCCR